MVSPEMILLVLAMLLFSISLLFTLGTVRENHRVRSEKRKHMAERSRHPANRVVEIYYLPPGIGRKSAYTSQAAEKIHQSKFNLDLYV